MNRIILLTLLFFLSKGTMGQTKIIAHRGFSGIAPENTLVAFRKAIESGANYIELDVHATKDDSLVVIHDASVNRTSSNGMKGKVDKMTYDELTAVNVGYSGKFGDTYQNEKIPTLREVLETAKGKIKVCIEIKVYEVEENVLQIVNDLNMNDDVIIFSFYHPVLAKIRQLDAKISILLLINSADTTTIDNAAKIEANAIGVGPRTRLTKEYLAIAHEQGIEVWKWTVNKEDKMKQLIDMGVDGLITNFPDVALKNINND